MRENFWKRMGKLPLVKGLTILILTGAVSRPATADRLSQNLAAVCIMVTASHLGTRSKTARNAVEVAFSGGG